MQMRATAATADFGYSRDLVAAAQSDLSETVTDFVLIGQAFTDPTFRTTANGGRVASEDGDDIKFTASNNVQFAHNLISYGASTGAILYDLKFPTWTFTNDVRHRLFYGNSGVAGQQDLVPVTGTNITVSASGDIGANLTAAIAAAVIGPTGTTLWVPAGTINKPGGGTWAFSKSGAGPSAPFIIRPVGDAWGDLVFTNPIAITGSDFILAGIDIQNGSQITINSSRVRLTRSKQAWSGGKGVRLLDSARQCTVDLCEFDGSLVTATADGWAAIFVNDPAAGTGAAHRFLRNHFHDIVQFTTGDDNCAIQIGSGIANDSEDSGILIAYSLFEDCLGDNETISIKASQVTVQECTFVNCQGPVIRQGSGNVLLSNWLENIDDVRVYHKNHKLIGNVISGTGDFSVINGESTTAAWDAGGEPASNHPQSRNVVVAGNTGPLRIGHETSPAYVHPAVGTRVEAHAGTITCGTVTTHQTGTLGACGASPLPTTFTIIPAVKLTSAQVGLAAAAGGVAPLSDPAGCYSRTAAVWTWPLGADVSGNGRSLTPSSVTAGTLKGPAGVFLTTSHARLTSPTWAAIPSLAIEFWVRPTARGRILRIGPTGSSTSPGIDIRISDTSEWAVTKNTAAGIQVSRASGAITYGQDYHVFAVFGSGANNLLYINGAAVTLEHDQVARSGNILAASTDELAIGDPTPTDRDGFAGTLGRVFFWPFVPSAGWVRTSYRLQADQVAIVGISAENQAGVTNRGPVAVPMTAPTTAPGANVDTDVAVRAFDPNADVLTASIPSQPTTGVSSIVAGKVRYRPNGGTGGQTHTVPFRVSDGTKTSDSIIRVPISGTSIVPWFVKPDRGGRQWPAGHSYYERSYATWSNAVGRTSARTDQCTLRGVSDDTWEGIWGGPHTETIGPNMSNVARSQTSNSTTFAQNLAEIPVDSCFLVPVFEMWERSYSTSSSNNTRLYDFYDTTAGRNFLQAGFIRFGRRLYNMFKRAGWTDTDLLVCRPTHEMNQTNITRVYSNTRLRWRAMTEDFYAWMREGFAGPAGDRLRIIHSPGSFARIGPYDDWIPQSVNGGVDLLTISYHPSKVPGNNLAGVLTDFWDGNNNEYGHTEVLAACSKLGIGYCSPEWGPNFGGGSLVPCPQSDLVVQQFNKFCRAQAKINNIAFENQYNQTMLQEGAYTGTDQAGKDAWVRMVRQYRAMWIGRDKGTPLQIDATNFSVTLSGATVNAFPIANCTGSEAVRIARIVSIGGGLSAVIGGTGPSQRIEIGRGSATAGAKKIVVEMRLESQPYLIDIEITVNVT